MAMFHIIGTEPQFENIIKNGPFIPMTAGQGKPKNQWTKDERKAANLDQRLKSLIMLVLLDDQINSIINCLTAKSTCDDLILYHEGPSDVKESRVMDLKLYYNTFKFKEGESLTQTFTRYKALMNELEENLIDNIYETKKNKSLVSATPLSIAFFSSSIVHDFQDTPDNEEDTRNSYEYLNDLEKEYKAKAFLAKSTRFFKKEEESSDDNEIVEAKVLMALAKENNAVSKEGARNGEWIKISIRKRILEVDQLTEDPSSLGQKDLVFIKSLADDSKVTIHGVERPWLSKKEGFILPNHDTGRILPVESQRNITNPSVAVIDSLATTYDSADESSICSTPLPPLKKLNGVEPISGPKTIKSILRSKSTFKTEALKGVIINKPSSAPAKGNKSSLALKVNSDPTDKLKSVKFEDDPPLAIVIKEFNNLKLQVSWNQPSYSRSNQSQQVPQNALQNK
nr:hypothetical protein [Tanacetum cinerariifolium]